MPDDKLHLINIGNGPALNVDFDVIEAGQKASVDRNGHLLPRFTVRRISALHFAWDSTRSRMVFSWLLLRVGPGNATERKSPFLTAYQNLLNSTRFLSEHIIFNWALSFDDAPGGWKQKRCGRKAPPFANFTRGRPPARSEIRGSRLIPPSESNLKQVPHAPGEDGAFGMTSRVFFVW